MPVVDINDSNFDDLIESRPLVILDFWGENCAPCHSFAPVFEAASSRHPDILFGKINTNVEQKLAKEFEIFSVPTLIASREGTIVYARPGALTPDKLERLIGELRG